METNYLVVVGVDGSPGGRRALRWAVRKAAARNGMVNVIAAWRWNDPVAAPSAVTDRPTHPKCQAEAMLRQHLAELDTRVPIACQIVEGPAADVLCAAARDADLLVLGSNAPARNNRPVLGATAADCIRAATAPVVVVTGAHRAWQPAAELRPLEAA